MKYLNAAYVQRGDVPHCDALTVREVLRYAAYLRRTDHATVSSIELIKHHLTRDRYVYIPAFAVNLLRCCNCKELEVQEV